MKKKLISLIKKAPTGFIYKTPVKRDLLSGIIALYVNSLEEAQGLLPNFVDRVYGLIITKTKLFSFGKIHNRLYHLQVTEALLPQLDKISRFYLEIMSAGIKAEEKNKNLEIEFERSRIIKVETQAGYIKSINQLEQKVQELKEEIQERKRIQNELLEQRNEFEALNEEYLAKNTELEENLDYIQEINMQLEEAKQKAEDSDKLKSAFLANMSHEIRTPMNAIMGFSELLQEEDVEKGQQKDFSKIIYSRTKHLLQIINDIVDLSKIEANQVVINNEVFDLNEFLKTLYVEEIQQLTNLGKTHLNFVYENENKKDEFFIKSDKIRIGQVLYNLINNAIKFTEQGYVMFGYQINDNKELLFYVKDTGIGISQDKHEMVFERFRRGDENIANLHFDGTGLGLTISKNLVELMGGKIWIDSEVGKGTSFYFTLPYCTKKYMNKSTKNKSFAKDYNWQGQNILIVEDDPASQIYMRAALVSTQATIKMADTGAVALDIFKNDKNIDFILMDIRLPDISGLDVIKEIRKVDKQVPVVAQTAHAMSDDRNKCIEAGANNYISKPVAKKDLLTIIDRYL